MGEYMIGVAGAALCVGVLEEILPDSYGSKAYVRLLTALCLLLLILAPVGRVLRALPEAFESLSGELEEEGEAAPYEEILKQELAQTVQNEISEAVKRELATRFGVNGSKTDVGVLLSGGESFTVSRLVITLRGVDILKDPYEIEAYFSRLLSCECAVIVG